MVKLHKILINQDCVFLETWIEIYAIPTYSPIPSTEPWHTRLITVAFVTHQFLTLLCWKYSDGREYVSTNTLQAKLKALQENPTFS